MRESLVAECRAVLEDLDRRDLLRTVVDIETPSRSRIRIGGRELVLMCSNDYLGLASDPRLAKAAQDAADRWGTGSGASRLVSGATPLHAQLEARLAALEGTEDCVLFSSGYLANMGVISALVGPGDLIVSDELNHASIIDGCRLSRADVKIYPHSDAGAAASVMRRARAEGGSRRILVATDSVFSMDGDVAPLPDLVALCDEFDAWLMVDEAHATGLFDGGHGAVHALGVAGGVDVVVGTCSKALGSLGGFVASSTEVCGLLRNRARSFIFDTALPGPVLAATLAALDIVESDDGPRSRVRNHAGRIARSLADLGFDVGTPEAAIVPVFIGDSATSLDVGRHLMEAGVFARPIRPPTVPEGTARIRLCPMATHEDADIDMALDAFARCRPSS